jgi:methionyl aminopeptidase
MADESVEASIAKLRKCLGVGCTHEAGSLQCPTCLKQGINDSYFCSQQCFKNSWVGIHDPLDCLVNSILSRG